MSMSELPEQRWRAEIAKRLEQGDSLEFSLAQFARAVGISSDYKALETFLNKTVASGAATAFEAYRCPMSECNRVLSQAGAPYGLFSALLSYSRISNRT